MTTTVAILYPGAMGAALASVLHARNPTLRLVTSITGRSSATLSRATAAGLTDVPLPTAVAESDLIVSILPPSAAVPLAREVAALLQANPRSPPPIYVDANALAPATVSEIAGVLGDGTPLVDACVIGLPPKAAEGGEGFSYEPTVYLSADSRWKAELQRAAEVLGGETGWKNVKTMPDAGAGGASALKLSYAGIMKASVGIGALMVLAANAHSPGTARALLDELSSSSPDMLSKFGFAFHDMPPKAYRWVGEMDEISQFVSASLGSERAGSVHAGLATVFERIAADLRATGDAVGAASEGEKGDASEIEALHTFADEGKKALKEKGYVRR